MGALAAVETEARLDRAHGVQIPLRGETLTVKPVGAWPGSNAKDIKEQDFESWAKKCLASPKDVAKWVEIDPTYDEIEEFFNALNSSTGQHPKG